MQKKLAVMVVLLLLCIWSMTSCLVVVNKGGNDSSANSPEDTLARLEKVPALTDVLDPAKNAAEQTLDALFGETDYGKQAYTVTIGSDPFVRLETKKESSFDRALKIQNDLISSKLNCVIYVNQYMGYSVLSDINAAMTSGNFYADLLLVPQNTISTLLEDGVIYDLNGLYGDVFNADCYDAVSTSQFSGGNSLYGVVGDGAVSPGAYVCVYFNKDITDTYGLTDYLYSCATNGSWCIETMFEIETQCTFFEGATVAVESADCFIETMFGASGMKYFDTAVGSVPTVSDNGERLDSFVAKMKGYMEYSRCVYAENAFEIFLNGECIFYIDTLGAATNLSNNFGILPLPKLDSNQEEYYTYTTGDALVFVVPKAGARTECSADLLRVYNETAQLMKDAWKRDYLDAVLRDEASYHMLGIIFDTPTYDFACVFGEQYEGIADSSYNALKNAIYTEDSYYHYVEVNSPKLAADLAVLFPDING